MGYGLFGWVKKWNKSKIKNFKLGPKKSGFFVVYMKFISYIYGVIQNN